MLYEWIREIVVFTIFFSFILFAVPDEKYRKYIKNTIGFIMILVVMKPVLKLVNMELEPDFDFYYAETENNISDADTGYYRDVMENMIEAYINDTYCLKCDTEIVFDENINISRLDIYVEGNSMDTDLQNTISDDSLEGLKNDIAQRYNISYEKIYIG
jgi:stage III sporulation protein AF